MLFFFKAKLTDFQTEVEKENVETDDPEMEAEDELFPDLPASVRRHL